LKKTILSLIVFNDFTFEIFHFILWPESCFNKIKIVYLRCRAEVVWVVPSSLPVLTVSWHAWSHHYQFFICFELKMSLFFNLKWNLLVPSKGTTWGELVHWNDRGTGSRFELRELISLFGYSFEGLGRENVCCYFMAINNILKQFGSFCAIWHILVVIGYNFTFLYVVPRKIWQPWWHPGGP
jgi:hypothetical protein